MFWNFILTPMVLYAGFGRVVMLYERKTSLLQVAQAQELLLHTLPLGMLVFYNNEIVQKSKTLDKLIKIVVILSCIQMSAEILIHKLYLNMHVNLERRTALKSQTRLNDMVRVSIVSIMFNITAFLLGWFVF